ncbi:MAG: hypothetical protein ACLQO7_10520 [Candidatus Bathyarchaeia archaeon]
MSTFVNAYINYYQSGVLNPACDLNHDGAINFSDIVLFVALYQSALQTTKTRGKHEQIG